MLNTLYIVWFLSHVQGVVEGTLRGRHEVELLQAEEVRHGRNVVRENVLTEADDAPDCKKEASAPAEAAATRLSARKRIRFHVRTWVVLWVHGTGYW